MLLTAASEMELFPREKTERKKYFQQLYRESTNKKVLYIHTPYCPSKCHYCICQSVVCPDSSGVDAYVKDILINQIIEERDYLNGIQFEQVFFGGGTPTYMSAEVMQQLFEAIPNFRKIPIKCIEASPNTINSDHLKLLLDYEFSFLSIGIQSLQRDVCSWQNRYYLSKPEIDVMSSTIRASGLYFNYDLICYMGYGDIRDIPGFREDLRYVMSSCRPSSINIHQLHQAAFTMEKTEQLFRVIKEALNDFPEYECINARLKESEIFNDTCRQAQYRLVREKRSFSHYMWNKYPEVPVYGYDIFAIGYTDTITPKSNAGQLVFKPGTGEMKTVSFNKDLYREYWDIRKEKGIEEHA